MDFSIDTAGSPQDVQRRQKLADLLMQQGADTSPAAGGQGGGWITALNRGLAGALAGYQSGQIRQDELARNKANDAQMAALSSALMGGAQAPPVNPMGSVGEPQGTMPSSPRPKAPLVAALEEEDKPSTPVPAPPPGADSGLPTFGPNGKLMGNLTGNIGQPPVTSAPQPATQPTPNATVADRFPQQAPVQAAGQNQQAVAAAWAVIRNPYASPAAKQVASAIVTQSLTPKEVHTQEADREGNIWDVNRLTGQRTVAKAAEKDPESKRQYDIYVADEKAAGRSPISYGQFLGKGGPARPMTEEERAQYHIPASTPAAMTPEGPKAIGGGNTVINNAVNPALKDLSEQFSGARGDASSAADTIRYVQSARGELDKSGGVITGAGANERLQLQKVGSLLGVTNPEAITNTETFRTQIKPIVLSTVKGLGAGSGISNADREFAEKAAGGDITLDGATIRRVLDITERAARSKIQRYNKLGEQMRKSQPDLEQVAPMLSIDEPPAYSAPAQGKPQTVIQNGHTYTLQPDGSYR
ncbi:hypothetical protein [Bradyrhizobium sp. JR18.2]|uniref:hypothetical protein n=1 Tax=Bradyrhizobium sp. JR18.2 TaxID=3156369 RepID=UPI00339B7C43